MLARRTFKVRGLSVPRGRGKRKNDEPTREMRNYIVYQLIPEDILDDESYIEKMLLVRYRIIGVFGRSVDPSTRKGVYGNYLMGIGPRQSQLNRFLVSRISIKGLMSSADLTPQFKKLNYKWREIILNRVLRLMIERQVELMKENCDLWWLDYHGGIWEIAQSVADEQKIIQASFISSYDHELKLDPKQKFRDERSFHGRPSKQGRRRTSLLRQAPGMSTGT